MKKATRTVIILLLAVISIASCKKEYHCHCTFDNNVVKNVDLGNQTKDNANKMCSAYDTTLPGEVWTCTVY
jgi:hypothetical protein